MVYEWKMPSLYPISAQKAGEELNRIYKERGRLDAADVVEESKPKEAPLHPCFEWRDKVAAEKYREHQARNLINCVVTKKETEPGVKTEVRAFFHVERGYHPTGVILQKPDFRSELIRDALRYIEIFENRLSSIESLRPTIAEMRKVRPLLEKEVGISSGQSAPL